MMSAKKVNTKPVDYAALNQLSQDFETRFVPQTELSAKQAFWSQNYGNFEESNISTSTTIVEVLKELPKVSMVNSSLKKLKFHLASFDVVVKERITATAITEGTWGFEYTKACFMDEIILFVKALKELFNSFDQFLIDELTEYASQAQSSTPLSITYPSNDFQSSVSHNVYNPSSSIPQVEYASLVHQQSKFSQPDTGLVDPLFQKGNDPIGDINHMMSFLTAVVTSRYPPTNNHLRNSSNPRQEATINNGRVTIQLI
nr:hypothetical protein [Tanacetum cinerariifolium]